MRAMRTSGNSKPFWIYIQSLRLDVSAIPTVNSNDKLASSDMEKAQVLNSQFSSVLAMEKQLETVPFTSGPVIVLP